MECPICNNNDIKKIIEQKNLPFTNLRDIIEDFSIYICKKCSFVFQGSAYTKDYDKKIAKVYKNYFINHTFTFPRNDKTIQDALKFLSPYIKNNSNILEIGSARGDFLFLLKMQKPFINILGVEPASKQAFIPTLKSNFDEKIFSNKFDVIILRHVLEHIKYPKLFIKKLNKISHNDTIIYVEVPNLINTIKNFAEDFEPDHVSYFSLYTLKKLFNKYIAIDTDTDIFLRAIFKKNNDKKNIIDTYKKDSDGLIENNIKQMYYNKKVFFNKIQDEKRPIVFYGVSHYYYFFIYQLLKYIKLDNCYFYDDNFAENYEPMFKLQRISDLNNTLVITCSNVPYVQDKMEDNLKKFHCQIIKPWRNTIN